MEHIETFLVIKNQIGMIVSIVNVTKELNENENIVSVEIHKDYLYSDCLQNIRRFSKYTIARMMEDYHNEDFLFVEVPLEVDRLGGSIGDVTYEIVEKVLEFN